MKPIPWRLLAASLLAVACAATHAAGAAPSIATCEARANGTPALLAECIQQADLWQHLAVFQRIADNNPGPDGHGNRDTGTSGYKQSVAYVARLMRAAGYAVKVQSYVYRKATITGTPLLSVAGVSYGFGRDWYVARLSAAGTVQAPLEPVGAPDTGLGNGCAAEDFRAFRRGGVALMQRGTCPYDTQVTNAQAAGAAAVILYNTAATPEDSGKGAESPDAARPARLFAPSAIPVLGLASHAAGAALYRQTQAAAAPAAARLEVRTTLTSDVDYNLIADAPQGDPNHVVVVDGHLDAIYGAGMLDNASGSVTILEIALMLAHTPTANQLRYIWFGGEEIGLLGSLHYTRHLDSADLARIVFDVDVDVTATPNFDILIADPARAANRFRFPANVIPGSAPGNAAFTRYFTAQGIPVKSAPFGNGGTDSNSFSLVGVPNTGILTNQDCCKKHWEQVLWGGFLGNYEGDIPSFNGGCVDQPDRWCDNLFNNDPFVFELISRATAVVTLGLANDPSLSAVRR